MFRTLYVTLIALAMTACTAGDEPNLAVDTGNVTWIERLDPSVCDVVTIDHRQTRAFVDNHTGQTVCPMTESAREELAELSAYLLLDHAEFPDADLWIYGDAIADYWFDEYHSGKYREDLGLFFDGPSAISPMHLAIWQKLDEFGLQARYYMHCWRVDALDAPAYVGLCTAPVVPKDELTDPEKRYAH